MRDPVLEDTDKYYREQAEYERRCREVSPICDYCGAVIEEDFYELNDGTYCCQYCMEREFHRDIDAYIEAHL